MGVWEISESVISCHHTPSEFFGVFYLFTNFKMAKQRSTAKIYKRIYEKETGTEIPKWWHIHHIDIDPTNNDIENLVALPNEIHQQVHEQMCACDGLSLSSEVVGRMGRGGGANEFYYAKMIEFMKWYRIAQDFVDYRDFLRGDCPNIHNTSYEQLYKKHVNISYND